VGYHGFPPSKCPGWPPRVGSPRRHPLYPDGFAVLLFSESGAVGRVGGAGHNVSGMVRTTPLFGHNATFEAAVRDPARGNQQRKARLPEPSKAAFSGATATGIAGRMAFGLENPRSMRKVAPAAKWYWNS
jgi:hypothetical protein